MLTTAELITLADRSMPGLERMNMRDWVLRSALGSTGRANSVLPIGDPGLGVDDAIRGVESWYGDRDRPPIFQIFESADDLTAELSAAGYQPSEPTEVHIASIDAIRVGDPGDVVVHDEVPDVIHTLVGDPDRVSEITATPLLKLVGVAGEADGCGMGVVDGTAAGIFAMRTAPDAWGRGIGTAIFAALERAADEHGVTDLWLQVEHSNTRALEWYERIGFRRVDRYRYWRPPQHAAD